VHTSARELRAVLAAARVRAVDVLFLGFCFPARALHRPSQGK
jgi:hypothetical protein